MNDLIKINNDDEVEEIDLSPVKFNDDPEVLKTKIRYKNPSALSASVSSMTSIQRKMLGCLISEAQYYAKSVTSDKHKFKIPIANIKEILNINWMERTDIKKFLKPLTTISVEFNYLNKDKKHWVFGNILSIIDIEEGSSFIEFAFNPFLQSMILSPDPYTNNNLLTIAKIKVERADALYAFLVDYLKVKIPYLTIKEFRKIMGIDEDTYFEFKNFRVRVLNLITKEVNEKTDITCSYKLIRGRRKSYAGIQWTAAAKPGCDPTKSARNPKKVDAAPCTKKIEPPVGQFYTDADAALEIEPKDPEPETDVDLISVDEPYNPLEPYIHYAKKPEPETDDDPW